MVGYELAEPVTHSSSESLHMGQLGFEARQLLYNDLTESKEVRKTSWASPCCQNKKTCILYHGEPKYQRGVKM